MTLTRSKPILIIMNEVMDLCEPVSLTRAREIQNITHTKNGRYEMFTCRARCGEGKCMPCRFRVAVWWVSLCFYDDENNNFRSKLYAISGKVRQNILPHVVSNIRDEISPVKLEDIKMKRNITHIIQYTVMKHHSLRKNTIKTNSK